MSDCCRPDVVRVRFRYLSGQDTALRTAAVKESTTLQIVVAGGCSPLRVSALSIGARQTSPLLGSSPTHPEVMTSASWFPGQLLTAVLPLVTGGRRGKSWPGELYMAGWYFPRGERGHKPDFWGARIPVRARECTALYSSLELRRTLHPSTNNRLHWRSC